MTKFTTILVLILSALLPLTASTSLQADPLRTRVLNSSGGNPAPIEFEFTAPSFKVKRNTDGSSKISSAELFPISDYGMPDLQTIGKLFIVPSGYKAQITIQEQRGRNIPKLKMARSALKMRCERTFAQPQATTLTEIYPTQITTIEDLGYMQSSHMARLAVYPWQWNEKKNLLKITTKIRGRIDFVADEHFRHQKSGHSSADFANLAERLTINGQQIMRSLEKNAGAETMLIIAPESFVPALQPLVRWKTDRGINVVLKTIQELGGTNTKLKAFVQKTYDDAETKPGFLLLVGNSTSMPPFFRPTDSGNAASDYPFALLTGNDVIPDILVGRLIASTINEVNVQVSRWVTYERSPEANGAWYPFGTAIASSEGESPSDRDYSIGVQNFLKSGTYKKVDNFLEGEHTATSTNIVSALREGRTWLNYIGHGSGLAWGSTNNTFSTSTIRSLTNVDKLPVIVDVACENGNFIDYNPCFGKAWVTQTTNNRNAGAVAYYGASVSTSWDPPAVMATGAAKYHFEHQLKSVGASMLGGQLYLIEKMGTGKGVIDNLEWYNLFGDPSLYVRTATPRNIQVTKQIESNAEQMTITVHVQDSESAPVANTQIAISSKDTPALLATAQTDEKGDAILIVKPTIERGNLQLVAFGYNFNTVVAELSR